MFKFHAVQRTDSGTVYEDTVDNLSESELEASGLIFALAGYLVYELYEEVPLMLLDSLEAIDADRIGTLIEYLTTTLHTCSSRCYQRMQLYCRTSISESPKFMGPPVEDSDV